MAVRQFLVALGVLLVAGVARADDLHINIKIHPRLGPAVIKLGDQATLDLPAGYMYEDRDDTQLMLRATGGLVTGQEVGMVQQTSKDADFLLLIRYNDAGHVSDHDAGRLAGEVDAMLESIRATADQRNQASKSTPGPDLSGAEQRDVDGWEQRPQYDAARHTLVWGIAVSNSAGISVNYNTDILTRHGVLAFNMLGDPDDMREDLGPAQSLIAQVTVLPGQQYEDFQPGIDQAADYGLSGLIVGGRESQALQRTDWHRRLVEVRRWAVPLFVLVLLLIRCFWRRPPAPPAAPPVSPDLQSVHDES